MFLRCKEYFFLHLESNFFEKWELSYSTGYTHGRKAKTGNIAQLVSKESDQLKGKVRAICLRKQVQMLRHSFCIRPSTTGSSWSWSSSIWTALELASVYTPGLIWINFRFHLDFEEFLKFTFQVDFKWPENGLSKTSKTEFFNDWLSYGTRKGDSLWESDRWLRISKGCRFRAFLSHRTDLDSHLIWPS